MEDSGESMTGMLDSKSPESGDSPAMEGTTGTDDVTGLSTSDLTTEQPPESQEQTQPVSDMEFSVEHLKTAVQNIDQSASPAEPAAENSEQPPESNGQQEDQSEQPDDVKEAGQGDSESPSNMELEDAPKEPAEPAAEADPAAPQEPELPTEYERLSKVVEDNPEDFNGWVYLLQYVEQENHLLGSRKAFDAFFLHYPYCYGYWKKYADIERKHGYIQMADEVYRRGLQAIPLSVDLWLHYITFLRENQDTSDGEAESRIRASYEHAVLACGTDFRSDRLWEAYIAWETEQGKLANVTAIYDRLLCIPTQLYSQHFQKFKDHVQSNNPKHFLSEEEFVSLRVELANANKPSGDEDAETEAPGEELPPGTEDLPDPAKRVTEIENMRHKVIETRQEMFNHNEHEVSKRWAFEEGIKRPYFHVKALEKTQLNNWREYLDFELENGTPERVVVLFERCLIACALYEEFWIKYAKYLESYSTEAVRHIYKKACTVHLPKKPNVHLLWAAFEEQQGSIDEARSILKAVEVSVPGLAMVRLRRVSLERRHGNMEEAEALLQDAITNGRNSSESSFYSVKLARQLVKVQKSIGRAKKVLLEAVEKDETNPKLYLNLLELEYSGDVQQNEAEIIACFDRALSSSMALESRITFSQRKVDFLEDFGSDINTLMAAYEQHQRLLAEQESFKRKAENGSEEPDAKRQRTDDQSVASGQMMDMQANHAGYNYNNWYQYNSWGSQNSWGQYGQYGQYNQYYPPPPT
ncbi:pre-mRNA-processing factor 39 [Danio rerio]|uniref:Pre-mRNA-processing factor 39 n=1 Tax=Danio rerio TaxID=7955 RepID=PRP39_DANRE|nr:pre-mRNA-processing factor 39 [Danio rerio]Q1JPZ7.2 RecName: Full=Pre-mRNA-processing factor 39; AltName: Full=PRP39 homolog [Danio rerio]CAD87784.1 novel protein similar to pre-mRNA processing proteins [Danio rerio]|eukprot:NP_001004520.1 pre-mRNA-processing factor 39 [Danio rerio]